MVESEPLSAFKGAQWGLVQIEKFSLNFSNSSIAIRINLLHPWSSLFLYGFLHFNNFLRGQNNSNYHDWSPLRWLITVSSTFQDVDFDVSLLPLVITWCYNHGIKILPNHRWYWYHFRDTIGYHSNTMTRLKHPYFSFQRLYFKNGTVKCFLNIKFW